MSGKIFYRKRLSSDYNGLVILTEKFISIRETECTHFCIEEYYFRIGAKDYETAKERGLRVRRIMKSGSRIAFETESLAMEHLKFLKRRQLRHIEREITFLKAAISFFDTGKELDEHIPGFDVIPGTKELVNEYLRFE